MNAQKFPFPEKWEELEIQLSDGKLKSIEPLLNEIYAQAKKENNAENKIKALIFKSKIAVQTSDDENIVTQTQKNFLDEITQANGIEKTVLQSLLAELYFNYYQENQYRIKNRTDLISEDNTDFRTWDTSRFLKEIDHLIQGSVIQRNALSQTKVENFDILLKGEDKWRFLRPNMYDVLANRALSMYEDFLFRNQKFNQENKNAQIQTLYSNLIEIHKNDKNKSAFIDAKLNKIKYDFIDNDLSNEYLSTLEELYKKYAQYKWSTNILYELAQFYTRKSDNDSNYIKAIKYCNQAIQNFPKSLGTQKCQHLKENIEFPILSFETDGTLFANQYNPLYISHKNTDKVYYRVYKLSPEQYAKNLNGFGINYEKKTLKTVGEPIKEGNIALKKFTDYKPHSTKIPFEPIGAGNYVLVFANNPEFKGNLNNHLFQANIISTKIDVATRSFTEKKEEFSQVQALNKEDGTPLKNKNVEILYAEQKRAFKHFKNETLNEFGQFNLKTPDRNYRKNYVVKFPQEETYFPVNNYYYKNNYKQDNEWNNEVVFFTDRGIYRPGQTVYFKAILYKSKGKERKIVPNQKNTIYLDDYNGEEIGKIELISNEFGSMHGEFILPTSGITGNFELYDDWADGYKSIQVEEYKRPKFKVEMDTLKGVYQLNEKVLVSGDAKMFSGANVTDAKVTYRVYRQAYNPYRWWWRPAQPESEEEITQGETTTNANGKFEFEFNAKPAKPKKANENRAYIYKVIADVVDVSGETHTGESSVRIGDIPYQLGLNVDEKIEVNDFKSLKIKTTNLNSAKTQAKGTLEITKILPLDRVLRDQQQNVDYELIPKNEFIQKLPYIAYNNEYKLENQPRGQVVLHKNWDTANTDVITWDKKLKAGKYEIKATSIYKNDTIETVKIVEVFKKNKPTNNKTYFSASLNKTAFQPNDKAEVTFTSDAENANVLVALEANGKIVKREILPLNNSNTFNFKIEENYRGNVFVHAYFNKFNEGKNIQKTIIVPFTNKELNITTSTLRNKLKTGQEETWELTIKDHLGDKLLAEVLVGMYDKSLDEFTTNDWDFFPYQSNYSKINGWNNQKTTSFRNYNYRKYKHKFPRIAFENLSLFGLGLNENARLERMLMSRAPGIEVAETAIKNEGEASAYEEYIEEPLGRASVTNALAGKASGVDIVSVGYAVQEPKKEVNLDNVAIRKNLQETAFFFPNLTTDKDGNVKISFTTPESLTTWNFQALTHTKDLKIGFFQSEVVTQKELMVVPNAPRFLREGDELTFKTKIINLSEKALNGEAKLMLFDAFTMQPVEAKFDLKNQQQNFEVNAGGNTTVAWNLKIPNIDKVQSVIYRVVAGTEKFSDGEENALPILTNRTLVTETMPMSVREGQTKTFTFDKLKNSTSNTRENFKLTMEMTTNPIWYAVMALPYLREYPYECSEQVFSRFYGNVISQNIVNSNPKIKAVFDDWNKKGELISPLEKNEELKSILLEETPWVRNTQSESEQMKRIAVLFDLNKMRNELQNTYKKLEQKQASNGGFPWFEGGRESYYITTHIVTGFGHLEKMGMNVKENLNVQPKEMIQKAVSFIDAEMEKRWDEYQKDKKRNYLSQYDGMYWLYARSYFLDQQPLSTKLEKAKDYFITELNKEKFKLNIQQQAMLSLVLQRYGKTQDAKKLIFSIKDRAVESDEMGMYWKENVSGYAWHQAPIEAQALLIEAFDEITPTDVQSIESMKVWLLKNKQTNQWNSTKATTEAVYALMNTGKDWTNAEEGVTIKIGNKTWQPKDKQAGSGYVKQSWNAQEITPKMGEVKIEKTSPGVAWGAMYWQYFEDLNKISGANTHVKLNKQLFIQRNTDQGPKLFEITENEPIETGDLVKVRLEIQTDRAMDFVHIKDMRASGFEPVNVISKYKWQDSLGYYESTRDAATNFFIDHLPKGVYVFEYDLRANNAGTFSNGITQMQNMYAPEFSAHSKGINVEIK